jgi:hypothetical protein
MIAHGDASGRNSRVCNNRSFQDITGPVGSTVIKYYLQ